VKGKRIMVYRILPRFLAALALVLFVAAPQAAAQADQADSHEGKVVSVTGNKLVMTGKDGKEHSHTLSADAKVTCDSKACKAEDLKPGQKIRVTTKKGDTQTAVKVEALDKNEQFEKSPGK
jgi:Ni/Co efflux regulator RcnB